LGRLLLRVYEVLGFLINESTLNDLVFADLVHDSSFELTVRLLLITTVDEQP
jgi:hypothetical protein